MLPGRCHQPQTLEESPSLVPLWNYHGINHVPGAPPVETTHNALIRLPLIHVVDLAVNESDILRLLTVRWLLNKKLPQLHLLRPAISSQWRLKRYVCSKDMITVDYIRPSFEMILLKYVIIKNGIYQDVKNDYLTIVHGELVKVSASNRERQQIYCLTFSLDSFKTKLEFAYSSISSTIKCLIEILSSGCSNVKIQWIMKDLGR